MKPKHDIENFILILAKIVNSVRVNLNVQTVDRHCQKNFTLSQILSEINQVYQKNLKSFSLFSLNIYKKNH